MMPGMTAGYSIPAFPELPPAEGWNADATAVTAVIFTEDRRFLLQLRDEKPDIILPGHWTCFGGHVEPGEAHETAIWRELDEELRFRPASVHWLFESVYSLPRATRRRVRNIWYAVPLALAELPRLELHEGSGMQLFTLEEALMLPKMSPVDLCAMIMLARHGQLYPPPSVP
jgi:8-oxo-dGTP pyrophosphatase MutT (NUDIX family)